MFAEHQPITRFVNAARYLAEGGAGMPGAGGHHVLAAVVWCVAILAVTVPACVALFRRR